VVVSEWVPIIEELQSRGMADHVILVGVLTSYELPLKTGQKIWGRLPKAFTTVASVTGRDVTELKTAWVARTASSETAIMLVADLKELASKLTGLPGVLGVPRYDGLDPKQLAIHARMLAAQDVIPVPTASQASPEWIPLLRVLRAKGFDDPDVLHFLLHSVRLRLASGTVIEPLDEDARFLTVATAVGMNPAELRQGFFTRMLQTVPGGPNPIEKAMHARAVLKKLPEVEGLEEIPLTTPRPDVKPYREGDALIGPPWQAFPEPPYSLRWRMGPGEDFMDRWLSFWEGLPESVRRDYLSRYPPPPVWSEWLARI
jgi:hypothetical protein